MVEYQPKKNSHYCSNVTDWMKRKNRHLTQYTPPSRWRKPPKKRFCLWRWRLRTRKRMVPRKQDELSLETLMKGVFWSRGLICLDLESSQGEKNHHFHFFFKLKHISEEQVSEQTTLIHHRLMCVVRNIAFMFFSQFPLPSVLLFCSAEWVWNGNIFPSFIFFLHEKR